jgi:hypothetical protein
MSGQQATVDVAVDAGRVQAGEHRGRTDLAPALLAFAATTCCVLALLGLLGAAGMLP